MRIGVYGGSFNPPHVGHAMVAAWLRWTDQVDEVWLVPVHQHAFDKAMAPFGERLAWCHALAADVGAWVRVCPIERDLPTPSFTIHTLRALAAAHPAAQLRLVVGSDVLPDTPRWRAWDEIVAEFPPIVVGRSGYAEVAGAPLFPRISSTEIRDRIARGEGVEGLLSARVRRLVVPGT